MVPTFHGSLCPRGMWPRAISPLESLAREQTLALAKTRATWKPPSDPPHEPVNIYPTGSSIPHWGSSGSRYISGKLSPDIEHEPFWLVVDPSLGHYSPALLLFPAFINSVNCPRARIPYRAASTHSELTHTITYTHPVISFVRSTIPSDFTST